MTGETELRRVEEAGFNAWPALQTVLLDGWVLRFANGYTKRANSVNPLYPGEDDIDQSRLAAKVDACQRIYARHALPSIFRLTSFGTPDGLDEILEHRGFTVFDRTNVMRCLLAGRASSSPREGVKLLPEPVGTWLPRYAEMSRASPDGQVTHRMMLERITGVPLFATLHDEAGTPVACGLAVLDDQLVGLYDIVTDPEQRKRGYGRALVSGMLDWAAVAGATHAVLSVIATNDPARALYQKLGFADIYHYWYRIPPKK